MLENKNPFWGALLIVGLLLGALMAEAGPLKLDSCLKELRKLSLNPVGVEKEICDYAVRLAPHRGGVDVKACFQSLIQSPATASVPDATNICRYLAGWKTQVDLEQDSCMQKALEYRSREGRKAIYPIDAVIPGSLGPLHIIEDEISVAAKFCLNLPSTVACALGPARSALMMPEESASSSFGRSNAGSQAQANSDLIDILWNPILVDQYTDENGKKTPVYMDPDHYPFLVLGRAVNLCQRGNSSR